MRIGSALTLVSLLGLGCGGVVPTESATPLRRAPLERWTSTPLDDALATIQASCRVRIERIDDDEATSATELWFSDNGARASVTRRADGSLSARATVHTEEQRLQVLLEVPEGSAIDVASLLTLMATPRPGPLLDRGHLVRTFERHDEHEHSLLEESGRGSPGSRRVRRQTPDGFTQRASISSSHHTLESRAGAIDGGRRTREHRVDFAFDHPEFGRQYGRDVSTERVEELDERERLVREEVTVRGRDEPRVRVVEFTYDDEARVVSIGAPDTAEALLLALGPDGRMERRRDPSLEVRRDQSGRQLSATVRPTGSEEATPRSIQLTYDAEGRPIALTSSAEVGWEVNAAYAASGALLTERVRWTSDDDDDDAESLRVLEREYDPSGRLLRSTVTASERAPREEELHVTGRWRVDYEYEGCADGPLELPSELGHGAMLETPFDIIP